MRNKMIFNPNRQFKSYKQLPNSSKTWRGLQGYNAKDSVLQFRVAIRTVDRAHDEYDCIVPDPDFLNGCVRLRVNEIVLIQRLRSQPDIYEKTKSKGIMITDFLGMPLPEKLKLTCEMYDIFSILQISDPPDGILIEDMMDEVFGVKMDPAEESVKTEEEAGETQQPSVTPKPTKKEKPTTYIIEKRIKKPMTKKEELEAYLEEHVEIDESVTEAGLEVRGVSFNVDEGYATIYIELYGKVKGRDHELHYTIYNQEGKIKGDDYFGGNFNSTPNPKRYIKHDYIDDVKADKIGKVLVWYE